MRKEQRGGRGDEVEGTTKRKEREGQSEEEEGARGRKERARKNILSFRPCLFVCR